MNDYKRWLEAKIEFCRNEEDTRLADGNSQANSLYVNFSRNQLADFRRSLASVLEYQAEIREATRSGCCAADLAQGGELPRR